MQLVIFKIIPFNFCFSVQRTFYHKKQNSLTYIIILQPIKLKECILLNAFSKP